MSGLNCNQFKSTTIYGNLNVVDYVSGNTIITQANTNIQRNLNVSGNIIGNVVGNLVGNVSGNIIGNVSGNLIGDVTGNLIGNIIGNCAFTYAPTYSGNITASNQLVNKSYCDSIAGNNTSNLINGNNVWTGSLNNFQNNVLINSGSSIFIGNGITDSAPQKLRFTVNASTGRNYIDWNGDNNLYMRIGTTPTTYYTFGTNQLTLVPSILRINNVDISSDSTGFTFGATTANVHTFNGSLNVSSYLTTTNNISCPNIIVSTNTQTSSLSTGTINASGTTTLSSNTTITASTGTSLVITGTGQTSTPPNSANGTFRIISSNTAENTYSTIAFHANDSGGSNRNCATIAMYKASTWATSSYPTDLIFYSRPASGNQLERLRLTNDNKAIFSSTIQTNSIDPNSSGYIVIGNNALTNADCSFYPAATTGSINFLSNTFSLDVGTMTFKLMSGANMQFWNTLSTKSSQIFSDNNGGLLFQHNNSGSSHTFSTMSGTTSTNSLIISNANTTINNPLIVNNTINTTSTISSSSSISANSFSVTKGNMFYTSSNSGMNYGNLSNVVSFYNYETGNNGFYFSNLSGDLLHISSNGLSLVKPIYVETYSIPTMQQQIGYVYSTTSTGGSGTALSITSATTTNLLSIASLSAGTWLISVNLELQALTSTVSISSLQWCISGTTASLTPLKVLSYQSLPAISITTAQKFNYQMSFTYSSTSSFNQFLNISATYTGGTLQSFISNSSSTYGSVIECTRIA